MSDDDLLKDLEEAEHANIFVRQCLVCTALGQMSETARTSVERALAGTIGQKKLARILTANGYEVSERSINNHRSEGRS